MGAVRLANGSAVQVRVGVLQGIGPIGPRGLQGEQGQTGPQGVDGPTGPAGAVTSFLTKVIMGGSTSVGTNTDTLVSFSSTVVDELNAVNSSTAFQPDPGDYMCAAWIDFALPADAGDSIRKIIFRINGVTIAMNSCLAVADEATSVAVNFPHRFASGDVLSVYARHSDNLSVAVTAGALSLYRIGSGPRGTVGPQGTVGAVGPIGPQGPQGATGSAGTGYATYADIL